MDWAGLGLGLGLGSTIKIFDKNMASDGKTIVKKILFSQKVSFALQVRLQHYSRFRGGVKY